jgi:cytoskeletal protein RodZ
MTFEQIGQKIRSAREGQGLTLAQIYERTKIPVNHLAAIDYGSTDELPEPVYVAGFIKRYAECVGLNGQLLSDEYRKSQEEGNGGSPHGKAYTPQPASPMPTYFAARTRFEPSAPNPFKWMAFYGFWIVCLVALVGFLFTYVQNMNNVQQDPSVAVLRQSTAKFNSIQAQAPNVLTSSDPATAPTTPTPLEQPQQPKDARIALTASQHVWVDVKALSSGESLYTGYLEAGDRRDFQDSQGVTVRAGNGGSLSVDYQGKNETFGTAGKVSERSFTAPANTVAKGEDTTAAKPADLTGKPVVAKKPNASTVHRTGAEASLIRSHRHAQEATMPEVAPSHSIDVPYRYTEGHSDNE